MATKTQPKNYDYYTKDGYGHFSMKEKGADGLFHGMSFPLSAMKTEGGRKMSRKQIIDHCLSRMAQYYPVKK